MIISGVSLVNTGFVSDVQPLVITNLVASYDPNTGISGTTFNDGSGNGYNATLYNSPSTVTLGNGQKVLQLSSASSQYYYYPSGYTTLGGAVTFDMWFNSASASTNQTLLTELGQAGLAGGWQDAIMGLNQNYHFAGGVYCSSYNGYVATSSTYSANTWYNMVVTYGSNTITLYINGVSQGTQTNTRTGPPNPLYYVIGHNDFTTSPGAYLGGVAGYFNGYIGPVKFYSTALTQAQVTQNFNAMRWRYGV